jgi:ribosomal protein L37E
MNLDDTARFFGPSEKLWPELFGKPSKAITRLCADCRKVEVKAKRRFCGACAYRRKLERTRASKRGLKWKKSDNVSPSASMAEKHPPL